MTAIIAAVMLGLLTVFSVGGKEKSEVYDGATWKAEATRLNNEYRAADTQAEIEAAVKGLTLLAEKSPTAESAAFVRRDQCYKAQAAGLADLMDEACGKTE